MLQEEIFGTKGWVELELVGEETEAERPLGECAASRIERPQIAQAFKSVLYSFVESGSCLLSLVLVVHHLELLC